MDSVVHFEIPFDNHERAIAFYKKTFGWIPNEYPDMEYVIMYTTETDQKTRMIKKPGGINGGMMKRSEKIKSPVITIAVKKMDDALKKAEANGGSVYVGKMTVGDMGYSAYIKDPEGNIIGLFEPAKM